MLVDFAFSNYLSYYEQTDLLLKANKDTQFRGINTFSTKQGELLKSMLIFGANGSGKSNLIDALSYVCDLILSDVDLQVKKVARPNYFGFNKKAPAEPTTFEMTFIINDICYIYGFEIGYKAIIKEYLYKKVQRRKELFYREGPHWESIRVSSDFDNVRHLRQNTRVDALFLSWANLGNNNTAMEIYQWFRSINIFDADDEISLLSRTIEYIEGHKDGKDKLREFLKRVDINIEGFDIELKEEPRKFLLDNLKKSALEKIGDIPKMRFVDVKTKHIFYDEAWEETGLIDFNFGYESDGTRKIFELAGSLIQAIENDGIIVIDEIDTRLHPKLVNYILKLFNSSHNTNAQIICTTHNISLLDEDIRRDQFCMVDKSKFGVSHLRKVSDIKGIRKNSKMLKMYLQGDLKGVPMF